MKTEKLAIITGDWNDADYVHRIETVSDEDASRLETVESIERELYELFTKHLPRRNKWYYDDIISYLRTAYGYYEGKLQLDDSDRGTEDYEYKFLEGYPVEDVDTLLWFHEEYMPSGYECSCHSLDSITIYEVIVK